MKASDKIADLEKELSWLREEVRAYGDPSTLSERVKKLEGHRNLWRRIAFRLSDELAKHDKAAANEIIENADTELAWELATHAALLERHTELTLRVAELEAENAALRQGTELSKEEG